MKTQGGSIKWNGDKFMLLAIDEAEKAITKAAIYTQGVAKKMVGGTGSGKLYKRKSVTHQASISGQPPARDAGILTSSISYTVKRKLDRIKAFVGSDVDFIEEELSKKKNRTASTTDVDYGYYLEKGTKHMAARPWLKPSLIKARPKILQILQKAFGK